MHITVDLSHDNADRFYSFCKKEGIKSILIDTGESLQPMTSQKFVFNEDYVRSANKAFKIIDENFNVIRTKVEIEPFNKKFDSFVYYESHIRLVLDKQFDDTPVRRLCRKLNFHMSKNLLKSTDEADYQMITYRKSTGNLSAFKKHITAMIANLNVMDISYDKIEIEECIYDSNESLDNKWLNLKT